MAENWFRQTKVVHVCFTVNDFLFFFLIFAKTSKSFHFSGNFD